MLTKVIRSCYISSIITGDPPIPPPLHGATETMGKEFDTFASISCASSRLRQLGQAFFEPQIKEILGPQLVSIFRDMSTFISWREYYHLNRAHPNPEEMDHIHAIHWRSHFSALNFPFESQPMQNDMQEPCRIALLVFWNTTNQINQPESVLYGTLAAKLSDALEKSILESFWETSQGMLAWILLLGAFVTEGQPESRWFIMSIASGLRNTGVILWAEMESILLRYLYLERIHQKAFEQIWKDAIKLSEQLPRPPHWYRQHERVGLKETCSTSASRAGRVRQATNSNRESSPRRALYHWRPLLPSASPSIRSKNQDILGSLHRIVGPGPIPPVA